MRSIIVRTDNQVPVGFSGDEYEIVVDEGGILRIYRGNEIVYTSRSWVDVIRVDEDKYPEGVDKDKIQSYIN